MTMQNVGMVYWPRHIFQASGTLVAVTLTAVTFDNTADKVAYVGHSRLTDTIETIYFRTGNVTAGTTVDVRVETVTNGRPSGTLWAANTNITVDIADGDDNVWKTATLTSAASVAAGDQFAIVIVYSSGATPNLQFMGSGVVGDSELTTYPLILLDNAGGGWAQPSSCFAWQWFIDWGTAGVSWLSGLSPATSITATAFNSGSSPDEYALKFVPPVKARCIGAGFALQNVAAGADFTISLWPSSSSSDSDALAQVTVDGDSVYATNTDGFVIVYWDTAVTLTAGSTYYIGIRADTANSLTLVAVASPSGITDSHLAFPIPTANFLQSTRVWTTGSAGAWTDGANNLPLISAIVDQFDDGASSGGGGEPPRAGGANYHPGL